MVRGSLVMTLLLVLGTAASAQPAGSPPALASQTAAQAAFASVTDQAGAAVKLADQHVVQLAAQRVVLNRHYLEELDAIDRLKNQRASWRRDRELRDSLSSSLETANQLSWVDREIKKANLQLLSDQRSYLAALDAELAVGATPSRTQLLQQSRTPLALRLAAAPHRIVIPDLEIDPLADPEELDQRAVELRASEAELNRQLVRLDQQAGALDHLAMLRKQHDRAGDLFTRDNDEPQRGNPRKTSDPTTSAEDGPSDPRLPTSGGGVPVGNTPIVGFESFVPTILSEVVDASTMASFAAAERSADPTQRADAARRARTAIELRLEQIKHKRAEIEARSRRLRGKR